MSQSWVVVEGDYGVATLSGGVAGASQRRGHRAEPYACEAASLMILGVGYSGCREQPGLPCLAMGLRWSRLKGRPRGWAKKGQGGRRCIWRLAGAGIEAVWVSGSSLDFSVRQGFVGSVRSRLGGKRPQWEEQG